VTQQRRPYTPSPWIKPMTQEEIKEKYVGEKCFLNGRPATINSTLAGDYAIIISSTESGEVSWFMLKEGMTRGQGEFKLVGDRRAVGDFPR
jgi:hypothetical protein